MAAVRMRLGAELRSRWRSWLALAALAGLFAGAVTAVVAGARRTETSYQRFLIAERAPDVLVFAPPGGGGGTFASFSEQDLASLPGVKTTASGAGVGVARPATVNFIAPTDRRVGTDVFRKKILAGRDVDPAREDEVTVSFVFADAHHVQVGDRLSLDLLVHEPGAGVEEEQAATRPYTFRVVGIDAAPTEFPPQLGTGVEAVWATPAFYRAQQAGLVYYGTTGVWFRHGLRDFPSFEAALRERAGGKIVQAFPLADQSVNTQHSIHLQAIALWMLAALLAITAVLVLTQLLMRQSLLESVDYPQLRALGMNPSQLWTLGLLRGAVLGILGACVAVAVAYLASPLLPVGLARTAEPDPGFSFDGLAIPLGALGVALVITLAGAWPAWRAARAARHGVGDVGGVQARPSAVAEALSRPATPASVTTGVRLALEPGRGRTAVPVRSTIAGAIVGVAALATALAFSASLSHLLNTPPLYGVSWDARIGKLTKDDVALPAKMAVEDSRVSDVSVGYSGVPITINGRRVDAMAMESLKGVSMMPTPLRGRAPAGPDELMLGSRTMADLKVRLGSVVQATVADSGEPLPFRVVGEGVFPSLSDAMGLGKGAAMTPGGLQRAVPPGADAPPDDQALLRFRPGVSEGAAIAAVNTNVARNYGDGAYFVIAAEKPVDLVNFGRVQTLPLVLAALLGTLAALTLAHLLVTSIRRRRRDLAILKTIGFSTAQVQGTVAWQATTLAVLAAVVGIPIGVACGRWVWVTFAHQLGIVARPTTPWLAIVALAALALVVANLVALLPGRAAARVSPARALRTE